MPLACRNVQYLLPCSVSQGMEYWCQNKIKFPICDGANASNIQNVFCGESFLPLQCSEIYIVADDALISERIIYGRHICVTWLLIRPAMCSFCGLLPPKLCCDHHLCYLFLAGTLRQSDLHVLKGIPDCKAESENTWEKTQQRLSNPKSRILFLCEIMQLTQ